MIDCCEGRCKLLECSLCRFLVCLMVLNYKRFLFCANVLQNNLPHKKKASPRQGCSKPKRLRAERPLCGFKGRKFSECSESLPSVPESLCVRLTIRGAGVLSLRFDLWRLRGVRHRSGSCGGLLFSSLRLFAFYKLGYQLPLNIGHTAPVNTASPQESIFQLLRNG